MPWPDGARNWSASRTTWRWRPVWRDQVANVRMHETTRERPVDRFQQERSLLRALPAIPFDTDEVVPAVVSPHARIEFDGNRYSVPPQLGAPAGHDSRRP